MFRRYEEQLYSMSLNRRSLQLGRVLGRGSFGQVSFPANQKFKKARISFSPNAKSSGPQGQLPWPGCRDQASPRARPDFSPEARLYAVSGSFGYDYSRFIETMIIFFDRKTLPLLILEISQTFAKFSLQ